ncbi:MAG TPA: NAD(P)-dependent alcohol dehydrogenase, partial [Catalimonadaceae bacterium]|nr:NAD(P)-dependent alcohol dehydrogenase [Catalimonadaceae bacterium]
SGLLRPKIQILGSEFAGIVAEIGSSVSTFKPGDRVFGYNDETFGGHAEFLVIKENEAITQIPENLTFEEAAPITEGAHYALNNIRVSKIKACQHALVYGATGAIGSAAVQLLKQVGAHVTAVCNSKNVDLVKSLGADVVIDYQRQDFTKTETRFEFIFDAVGKSSFGQCKPLLTEKGIYISTELGKNGENIFLALTTPLFGGKRVLFPIPTISKADVVFLKELIGKGIFKPVIDRKYKMEEIVEAYRYVETGQKTGNVVLLISE